MYTSSFKSPCRKALLTPNLWSGQFLFATIENSTLMVSILQLVRKSLSSQCHKSVYSLLPRILPYIAQWCHLLYV